MITEPFPWELSQDFVIARANYMACAYNAAVNSYPGNESRARRKMNDLVDAINYFQRVEGRAKLDWLMAQGVIDSYTPCPRECEMRPGGLFHAPDCENDSNSQVSRARHEAVVQQLPERFRWAAWPSLVGAAQPGGTEQ